MRFLAYLAAAVLAAAAFGQSASAGDLPGLVVPDGLGVNIHFTDPRPGEMAMLAQAGLRWVRMDFGWGGTEREKGQYDFSAYDRLLAALAPHKIRALLILDYSNRHYDQGLSPASDEGRKAFARWAAAAARHFQGRGILWEMYNEPNIFFWKPKPDVQQYVKLALEVGKALRQSTPNEMYIGPATSEIDLPFLEACFKAGLLEYWCAVSVHPYRQKGPETAAEEYAKLRRLIAQYAPKGKKIPILSGEWGYSSAWKSFDEVKQGKMLPRQWLVNLANEVPLSIWYDWHDDGPDPKEPEHHFGTVLNPYRAGRDPVYDPKPAYLAAKTLTRMLGGFEFNKRLAIPLERDAWVLLFAKGNEVRLAAWTTTSEPKKVVIPASPGRFQVTGHTGQSLPPLIADEKGLAITLTDAPQFLVPEKANDLLRVGAAWQRAPLDLVLRSPQEASVGLSLRNPLDQPIRAGSGQGPTVEVGLGKSITLMTAFPLRRGDRPHEVTFSCDVEGMGSLMQTAPVSVANPLGVVFGPPAGGKITVRVQNPSGEAFDGAVRLTVVAGGERRSRAEALCLRAGQTEADVCFAIGHPSRPPRLAYDLGVAIEDRQGAAQLALTETTLSVVDDFSHYTPETLAAAWRILPDGDAKVAADQSISIAPAPPGLLAAGEKVLKITYRMADGWKFIRLAPQTDALKHIDGRPKALGLWLFGDGSGNHPRLRFVDSTGQTFQPSAPAITWKGWRYVEFLLDGQDAGHWGGANDGVVHGAIRWDSVLLIDSNRRATGPHELYLTSPVVVGWQ